MTELAQLQTFQGVTGRVHPITQVGHPVLSTPCESVVTFDDELIQLIADMFASMYAAQGVGLAANQISVNRRVFVYDCPDDDHVRHQGVVINPTLQPQPVAARNLDEDEEGCLSVLGQHALLARPDQAEVAGFDHTGAPITVRGDGLLARCLQHETDHLNGMLYIDRLPAKVRRKILKAHAAGESDGEFVRPETDETSH